MRMISLSVKNTPLRFELFNLPFLFWSKRHSFAQSWDVSSHPLLKDPVSPCFHVRTLLVVNVLTVIFVCFFAVLRAHLDMDDCTSGQIASGIDVKSVLVSLPSTHEQPRSRRWFQIRNLVGPIKLSGKNSMSVHVQSIIGNALIQIVQIGFCFASRHQCILKRIENNDSVGTFSGHHMVAIDKFHRHTPENSPFFHRVAISFRRLQLRLHAESRMI